jgi:hypothetical protein
MANVPKRAYLFSFLSLALLSLVIACSGHANSLLPSPGARKRHFRPKDLSQNYAAVILGDKPTGYYRLDDTGAVAADSSGNGYVGTLGQLFALQDQLKSASCAGVASQTSELGYWSSVAP